MHIRTAALADLAAVTAVEAACFPPAEAAAEADFAAIRDMDLTGLCIVSRLAAVPGTGAGFAGERFPGVTVAVAPSAAPKCVRCWTHSDTVGEDAAHPELCARCAAVVSGLER